MTLRFPPPLLGGLLIFWGYCNDLLVIAIIFALLIEGLKLLPIRWDLEPRHFQRVADLTSILFAVVVVYQFIEYAFHGIYGVLRLLPVCLLPLVLAQRISTAGLLPLSSLFISLRRQIAGGHGHEIWTSVEFVYGLICILAASSNELPGYTYFAAATGLVLMLLFNARAGRVALSHWLVVAALAVTLGFAIQLGMQHGYRYAEGSLSYWFNQLAWGQTNPTKTRTAIGHIGRLKLSDQIVLRVKAPLSIPLPLYLQDASYTDFNLGTWLAAEASPAVIDPLPQSQRWLLDSAAERGEYELEITAQHKEDLAVQPLPIGATTVFSPEIIELQRNELGTMLLEAIPGQLRYRVAYSGNKRHHNDGDRDPPGPADIAVPEAYRAMIESVRPELTNSTPGGAEAVEAVERFFLDNFKYSLIGKGYYPGRKPLSQFLTDDRHGHCEYFATATVLLLRELGVPARYSVGFVVDEYSRLEQAFVARARHAHAWAEAFVDGRWTIVDTTPASWFELEQAGHSGWQLLQDYLGWARYQFDRFRRIDRTAFNEVSIWLLPPLFLYLLWRLRGRIRSKPDSTAGGTEPLVDADPEDQLLGLLDDLHSKGYPLQPGETARKFFRAHLPTSANQALVERILQLHDRRRFAARPLSPQEKNELDDGVAYVREQMSNRLDAAGDSA